ncbi:hypothetical protein K438DRAFT_1767792 [Mycena galopus ATCC 62051]|nr:hypothetical protein K438DRAFT_1767792 [Mycena galopus ATCC 62051]
MCLRAALSASPAFARDARGGETFLATEAFLYADAAAEGAGQRKCLIDERRAHCYGVDDRRNRPRLRTRIRRDVRKQKPREQQQQEQNLACAFCFDTMRTARVLSASVLSGSLARCSTRPTSAPRATDSAPAALPRNRILVSNFAIDGEAGRDRDAVAGDGFSPRTSPCVSHTFLFLSFLLHLRHLRFLSLCCSLPSDPYAEYPSAFASLGPSKKQIPTTNARRVATARAPINTGISARVHTAGNSTPRPARVAARSAVRAPVATSVRAPESAVSRVPAATTTVARRLPPERIRAAVQLETTRAKAPTSTTSAVVRAPVAAPVRAPTPAVAHMPVTTRATTTTGPPASTAQVVGHTVTARARVPTSVARVSVSTVVRSSATATRLVSASVPGIAGGASRQIASKQALRPAAPSSALDAARSTAAAAPVYDYRLWDDDAEIEEEEEEEEEEEKEIGFRVVSLREVLDRIRRDSNVDSIPRSVVHMLQSKKLKEEVVVENALSDPEKWNSNWEALLRRDFTFPNGPRLLFHQKMMQIEKTLLLLDGALAGYPDLDHQRRPALLHPSRLGDCSKWTGAGADVRRVHILAAMTDVYSTAGNLNEARS